MLLSCDRIVSTDPKGNKSFCTLVRGHEGDCVDNDKRRCTFITKDGLRCIYGAGHLALHCLSNGVMVELTSTAADSASDPVTHPAHYTSGKIEVRDAIIDWKLSYLIGNVVKYCARAGKKDPAKHVEDLQKASQYLEKEIATLLSAQGQGAGK